ncbi:pacifastin-like protease inhibitor cvp4 isoform X3 [Anabrus simplex]|uniref:pacifastin-like protease inhibitor cvp4 isoform X3 n=1 Tax=Anabrus simplex TaxID=316456 RepID=UPI0035A32E21
MELAGALRLLLLVLCSLLITSVFADDNHSSDNCTPGSTFMVDCNTCTCGSDGVRENAECTQLDCSAAPQSFLNRVGRDADGVICNPLENFELGCNTCKCGSDGLVANAACTQNPCPRQLLSALSRKKRGGPMDGVLSERCFPGSPFKVDCNLCLCPVSGIKELAPCSDWVCPPPTCSPNDVECVSDGERCAPGITYMDECNMCICSQDGIKAHASCTFKLCPK